MKLGLLIASGFLAVGVSQLLADTIPVTNTDDSGPGSLRDTLANAADGDTINCSVTGTILLTSGELLVTNSVDIVVPGPANLAVDGNYPAKTNRVFRIGPGINVTIAGLTITNGLDHIGGAGIYNDHSTLTVSNCTVAGNSAGNGGGGIYNDAFGDIFNSGEKGSATLSIVSSTFSGNRVHYDGGAIYNEAWGGSTSISILNSTFSDNSAFNGGAINSHSGRGSATLSIAHSTFSGNSADNVGGSIVNDGFGGNATLTIGNTILNAGASGANLNNFFGTITSLGYNLSSDNGGGFLAATGDQINTDPLLGPLQDNGGPTFTHALLCGSPAIDKGKNFGVSPTDQRGLPRPFDDPNIASASGGDDSDIGAFEVQQVCNRPPVAKCKDVIVSPDASCTSANASVDDGSSDPDAGDSITLSQSPPGPYPLGTTPVTLTVTDSHGASSSCNATVTVEPFSRDINSYVLFAIDEMVFKGGGTTSAGPRGRILGGNVGVNGVGLFKGNPRLRFGGDKVFMSDGKQAAADTARLTSDHSVDILFVNTLSGNPPIVPRTCGPTPFACIDPGNNACVIAAASLPSCPPFAPGASSIAVPTGNTRTLFPGSYGDVRVNDGGVLNLSAGVYSLKSLSLGKNVKVMTTDSTEVRVAQNVFMNTNPFIGPACKAKFCVRSDGINNGFSVGFSQNGRIAGQWIVPNGEVNLGDATDVFGRIWAKSISSDFNVNITLCQ